jgi:hypothetical protein
MHANPSAPRITLRHLPLAARLTLALFLVSTGVGYMAALVQLHFQHASAGSALPTGDDAVRIFHGQLGKPVSQIERLLSADETEKFNGTGSMAAAFTTRSARWKKLCEKRSEEEVRRERRGERLALLAWVQGGADRACYDKDAFALQSLPGDLTVTEDYITEGDNGAKAFKIKSILTDRCVRCHTSNAPEDANAGNYPLETFEQIKPYLAAPASGAGAISVAKLAQSTHAHLLSFSMLYGLTGLILAFSSYPATLRVVLCPLPLLAQVVDISFWWLARLPDPHGPEFARLIALTGGVVAVGLLLQILFSLFDLFGSKGKFVLTLLLGSAFAGALWVHHTGVIDEFLAKEKVSSGAPPK